MKIEKFPCPRCQPWIAGAVCVGVASAIMPPAGVQLFVMPDLPHIEVAVSTSSVSNSGVVVGFLG
jgi:hypothetical protein